MFRSFSTKFGEYYFNVELRNSKAVRSFFSKERVFSCEAPEKVRKYFSGEKSEPEVDYEILASDFVRSVLEEVKKIPYGCTKTYGEIAAKLMTSPRAVGVALKKNPLPVIIPCHRVVAKGGLGGYSQGLKIKKALLELEGSL
ncbi:MAG: methylated-DNA--[protein]-cysteine S-methyltransferase [Archaeoglobaceae archaeon]